VSFVRSVLLLAGVACAIAFALFIGHAISTHEGRPVLVGFALAIYTRTGRTPATHGH
jgi:hypothetical protein